MSIYFKKGKGWRYDTVVDGRRYTGAWFRTKSEARKARDERRKEVLNPPAEVQTPIDMDFLELVNRRLDYVQAYNSLRHYQDYRYMARRWVGCWGKLACGLISQDMIQDFVLRRAKVSNNTANKEIRYLRATFNFGKRKGWIPSNPVDGLRFLPVEKKVKFIPDRRDLDRVIKAAREDTWLNERFPDTEDYLWTLRETFARMGEINQLTWADVDFKRRSVILYTRKKAGGHLCPRRVPMTERLFDLLSSLWEKRDPRKPWVFWNPRTKRAYRDRKRLMGRLCSLAKVPYFRFHAFRHSGASVMENANVPVSSIQRILGHEQRQTTEIYLHGLGESERAAVKRYEEICNFSHTDSHTGR